MKKRMGTLGLASAVAAVLVSCSPESAIPPGSGAPAGIDLASAGLVDLSYAYDDETLFWPTSPSAFELTELANGVTEQGYFYSAYRFSMPEHGGTHIDAPVHFAENGWTTGEIPLRRLLAPGVVIDMTEEANADPDALLTRARVLEWEERHGPIPEGAIVVLRTGWGARWPDAAAYLGDDAPGDASNLHFPSYGGEAARLLVEERRVGALGVDTASIDSGQSTEFLVHRIAAAANVFSLENVANASELPEKGFWVLALPMKIAEGSGGPVRIVAIVP